jgi:hypothetical protein
MKHFLILSFVFFSVWISFAQTGGSTTFSLLDLSYNARSTALGTDFISIKDKDLNLGVSNPSLYNSTMDKQFSFNQAFLAGGINYGMVNYAKSLDSNRTVAGNIRYINYGEMTRRDEAGVDLGTFRPAEFVFGVGGAKQINPYLSIGTNVNLLYSQLANYSSLGISVDIAGTYYNKKKQFLVTALVKNAGLQLKKYTTENKEILPVELQMAVSYKLEHAPFRFSLLGHHLNMWDITYVDPTIQPTIDLLTGETVPVVLPKFTEKLARHFTYQVELLLTKSFNLRFAYDYHRRQEMKFVQRPGVAGFSFGVGLNFKRLNIDYGLAVYSASGFNNMLTLRTDLSKWKK